MRKVKQMFSFQPWCYWIILAIISGVLNCPFFTLIWSLSLESTSKRINTGSVSPAKHINK